MRGIASLAQRKAPVTFTSKTRRQSESSVWADGEGDARRAGVVDQDVHGAERRAGPVEGRGDGPLVGDVEVHG